MKKLNAMIYTIIMVISILGSSVTAEETSASLKVEVSDTGLVSVTVEMDPNSTAKYTEVHVYKKDVVISQEPKDLPRAVYSHNAWDGAFFWYKGLPGKYYAFLLDVAKQVTVLAGPVEFEIPEILATPTPTEEPTQPPATPTPVPTASPTAKAPPTPTTDRTATPTVAVTPPAAAGSERSGTHTVLWICIGAAAVLAAGIVTVILVRKKK